MRWISSTIQGQADGSTLSLALAIGSEQALVTEELEVIVINVHYRMFIFIIPKA